MGVLYLLEGAVGVGGCVTGDKGVAMSMVESVDPVKSVSECSEGVENISDDCEDALDIGLSVCCLSLVLVEK